MIRSSILVLVLGALILCPLSECAAGPVRTLPIMSINLTGNDPVPVHTELCFDNPTYEIPGVYAEGPGHILLPGAVLPDFHDAFKWYDWPNVYTLMTGTYWDGTTFIYSYGYSWQGRWQAWAYVWGSGPLNLDGWHQIRVLPAM